MGTIEICPLSSETESEISGMEWNLSGEDRTCSYCGSWHPDEFISWCNSILNGDDKALPYKVGEKEFWQSRLSLSDKKNKFYIKREGIKNALDGAIKCYIGHLSDEQITVANETLEACNNVVKEKTK